MERAGAEHRRARGGCGGGDGAGVQIHHQGRGPAHRRHHFHRSGGDESTGMIAPASAGKCAAPTPPSARSEEHTSELQSLMRISYAVFCLKKKNKTTTNNEKINTTLKNNKTKATSDKQ